MPETDYAEILIQLQAADLALRNQLIEQGRLGDGYDHAMEQLHLKNADKLSSIMDDIGYPTADKVGISASKAAWLVIQHAISRPDFMRRCRDALQDEIKLDNGDPIQLAYLTDRIAVFEGRPQLYGTQFDWDEHGQMSPQSCDDIAAVDRRRAKLGLNTLAEQTRAMRERVKAEGQFAPVGDTRKKSYEEWRVRVGWGAD
ncbi:hypothetical protein CEQ90_17555 [Lewinellaceae bacterium SD302]|nr:hypothetical protein CEQ90_17555 [Lewinellaceae bacterium SD302]